LIVIPLVEPTPHADPFVPHAVLHAASVFARSQLTVSLAQKLVLHAVQAAAALHAVSVSVIICFCSSYCLLQAVALFFVLHAICHNAAFFLSSSAFLVQASVGIVNDVGILVLGAVTVTLTGLLTSGVSCTHSHLTSCANTEPENITIPNNPKNRPFITNCFFCI